MHHYPGPGGGMGGGMLFGLFGLVGSLVMLGLIALLVIFLVNKARGGGSGLGGHGPMGQPHQRPMPPALQILDERLANGEIEVEDYMTRKAALLGGANPAANEWTPQATTPRAPESPKPPTDDPSI